MSRETIAIADLYIAAQYFPQVRVTCEKCMGSGTNEIPHGTVPCRVCPEDPNIEDIGLGYTLRDMDAREEHYYIMHLLRTKYQIR